MHPKEMSSDNSSQRYTILNFAKVSVRHRGIAQRRFNEESQARSAMEEQLKSIQSLLRKLVDGNNQAGSTGIFFKYNGCQYFKKNFREFSTKIKKGLK